MRETKAERRHRLIENLAKLGFTYDEAQTLRRAEMTLQRWSELECGDSNNYSSWAIERDPETEKPFMVVYPHDGKPYRRPVADRERGALNRVEKLVASKPGLIFYHQSDPRGCALYVGRKEVINGCDIHANYNRLLAVCD